MTIHVTIDGTCNMTVPQLINLVKKAYRRTALIPSRGVWGYTKHYASASGALIKAFGEFPQITNRDWLDGFDVGFEYVEWHDLLSQIANANQIEIGDTIILGFGERKMIIEIKTNVFIEGFKFGKQVADAILNHWPDSPTCDSVPEIN